MKIFYVETGMGCCLIEASSENAAHNKALRDVGEYNGVQSVRLATDDDILWVHSMGGFVPETPRTNRLLKGNS